jgi:hypothetical protein
MTSQLPDSRPIIGYTTQFRNLAIADGEDIHRLEADPSSGGFEAIPLANMGTLIGQPDPDSFT